MVNPYQSPTEASAAPIDAGSATAEFRLSERHLRFAESKYLLFLCGGRLTFASLAMIALMLIVTLDPLKWFGEPGPSSQPVSLSLLVRGLAVMALATVIYLALIHKARRSVRQQLQSHGVTAGADLTVSIADSKLHCSGPKGTFSYPLRKTHLIRTGRGVIIALPDQLFCFVPKSAAFSVNGYRVFLQVARRDARVEPLLG